MSDGENKPSPRGLGRGLSALLGDVSRDDGPNMRGTLLDTPIDLIIPNPNQPRRTFDEEELKTLADTIKTHGVVQPIVIRKMPDKVGYYSIIAGERRWRAAQIAGLHAIPAVIRDYDDLETLKIAIVENLQRANLNAIEEAMAFEQLLDRFGYNQQTIADSIGRSRAYVANTLRLLGLPPEVQDMVSTGQLSAGHARAALASTNPLETAMEIISRGLSVRDAEKLVNRKSSSAGSVSRETTEEQDSSILADDVSNALGLMVQIKHEGEKGGTLIVHYKSLEQLDNVCRKLSRPN